MALSEAKMEDLRADALAEMEAEAEEFEHEAHYGFEAGWADECGLCREVLEDEANES